MILKTYRPYDKVKKYYQISYRYLPCLREERLGWGGARCTGFSKRSVGLHGYGWVKQGQGLMRVCTL